VARYRLCTDERSHATESRGLTPPDAEGRAGPPGDARLVARLRAGDEGAFADLVRREHDGLVRFAGTFVAGPEAAEEVVQEAWLAVIRGLASFEGRSSLRTWIWRIVANQARTRGVRDRRTVTFSALAADEAAETEPIIDPARFQDRSGPRPGAWADPPASWDEGERRVLGEELQRVVAASLEALPRAQALVMRLRDVAGWTSEEVCAALDISPGNQRILLHRARTRVRAAVERYQRDADV
jgi:RNA polymerase sigma-70 factor (ECF subfamily)